MIDLEPLPATAAALSLDALSARNTLPVQVHALLEDAIISGKVAPESRIHADEIAAALGVSRIPVREALRSLAEAGWVDIKPHYGVRVRARDPHELDDLFEFRAHVERTVATLAARRRTAENLAEFDEVIADGRRALDEHDAEVLDRAGLAFYAALRSSAHNQVMAATSIALEKRARFYYITIADRLGTDWTLAHERIVEELRRGDAEMAAALVFEHILETGRQTRALLFP